MKQEVKNIQPIVLAIGKDGVEEAGDYRVELDKLLQEVTNKDINYTQVWRTIVNGYPYKTPKELEVQSKEEAYFVTKQAIYCVMLNRSMDLYRGFTERGNRLVKAIEKLKNIGLYGTQVPQEAGLQASKEGELLEEKEHYSQAYTVTANVDISQYEVKLNDQYKSGIFIADSSGKLKQKFQSGETFKVMIPKAQANKPIDLEMTIKAKCKTYPIFYGVTTIQGTQDYAITYSAYGDFTKKVKLNTNFNTGRIQIKKINEETSEPIENVTFELLDVDGKSLGTATTNQEGIANFERLYPGNYQIKEVITGEQFVLNSEAFDITVEWNKTVTKTITNSYKKGNLKVIKMDKETQEPIEGVSFELIDIDGNIVKTGVTDKNGAILFENLMIGKYQLKEKQPNENYVLKIEPIDVLIEYDQTTVQEITNERKKGNLEIYKVDKEDHQITLSGVIFELYSKELEKVIGTYQTDELGKIFVNDLPIGEYELREIQTKEEYEIGENMNISIQWEKTTKITIENKKKPIIPEEQSNEPKKEIKRLPKTGF